MWCKGTIPHIFQGGFDLLKTKFKQKLFKDLKQNPPLRKVWLKKGVK